MKEFLSAHGECWNCARLGTEMKPSLEELQQPPSADDDYTCDKQVAQITGIDWYCH
jgi:hypothetical protein